MESAVEDSARSASAPSASDARPEPRRHSVGAVGPIGAISKVALQETFAELASSAQLYKSASSAAWTSLRIGAERHFGIEVSIEDPAFRELFGHLLQVEALLTQVRDDASSLAEGSSLLFEGSAPSAAAGSGGVAGTAVAAASSLQRAVGAGGSSGDLANRNSSATTTLANHFTVLAQCRSGSDVANSTGSNERDYSGVPAMVADAVWHTVSLSPNAGEGGSARYKMQRRVQTEVFEPLDAQLASHDRIRELVREQQSWRQKLEQCQRQVASIRKNSRSSGEANGSGSGLKPLSLAAGPKRLDEAEERLRAAQTKVASLDEQALGQLLQIKKDARHIVARPWAALAQIRTEFFAAMAGQWAPVATSLCDAGVGARQPSPATAVPAAPIDASAGGLPSSAADPVPMPSISSLAPTATSSLAALEEPLEPGSPAKPGALDDAHDAVPLPQSGGDALQTMEAMLQPLQQDAPGPFEPPTRIESKSPSKLSEVGEPGASEVDGGPGAMPMFSGCSEDAEPAREECLGEAVSGEIASVVETARACAQDEEVALPTSPTAGEEQF